MDLLTVAQTALFIGIIHMEIPSLPGNGEFSGSGDLYEVTPEAFDALIKTVFSREKWEATGRPER